MYNFEGPFTRSLRSGPGPGPGPGLGAEEKHLHDLLSETKRELRELRDRYQELSYRYDALQSSVQYREENDKVYVNDGESCIDISDFSRATPLGDYVLFESQTGMFYASVTDEDKEFLGQVLLRVPWVPIRASLYNPDSVRVVQGKDGVLFGLVCINKVTERIELKKEHADALLHGARGNTWPRVASVRKILGSIT